MAKTIFDNGNPAQGIKGTKVTAEVLNGLQNHVHDGVDADGHAEKIHPDHINRTGLDADLLDGHHWSEISGVTVDNAIEADTLDGHHWSEISGVTVDNAIDADTLDGHHWAEITGITVANADTVDGLHATDVVRLHGKAKYGGSASQNVNSQFVVPAGVTQIWLSGCAAGGAGGGASLMGGNGGNLRVELQSDNSTVLSLTGGGGGASIMSGTSVQGVTFPQQLSVIISSSGRGSMYGPPSIGFLLGSGFGVSAIGYGAGGSGKYDVTVSAGGGGAGESIRDFLVNVLPGSVLNITIGLPGSGVAIGGGDGAPGFLLVEW